MLTDVQQTLSYGRGKLSLKYAAIALPFAALGLFVLYILYFNDNFYIKNRWEVAVSGWGQQDDVQRSNAAGFNLHLVKPIDFDAVERILAQRVTEETQPRAVASFAGNSAA